MLKCEIKCQHHWFNFYNWRSYISVLKWKLQIDWLHLSETMHVLDRNQKKGEKDWITIHMLTLNIILTLAISERLLTILLPPYPGRYKKWKCKSYDDKHSAQHWAMHSDASIEQWHSRVKTLICAEGGHFKHMT